MRGKINLYGCGGGGINITQEVYKQLSELPDIFSKVSDNYIDTTDKTINKYPSKLDKFFKIESTLSSLKEIDGMAGERKNATVVNEIKKNLENYVDKLENKKNEYHVVIFSGSGGSGNIIASLFIKELVTKDFTVLPIVVNDSSNYLYLNNSINTVVTLNSIARQTKTAIPIIMFDNSFNGVSTLETEKQVNKDIVSFLTIVSMYTSGNIKDLDHQDMSNFFLPSRYKTFTLQPGVYDITVKAKVLDDENSILARTMVVEDHEDFNIKVNLLHNKVGICSKEYTKHIPEELFPNYLTIRKNVVEKAISGMKEKLEELEKLKVVKSDSLDMLTDSSIDDDTGLVL